MRRYDAKKKPCIPGEEGFARLRYAGQAPGIRAWIGMATGVHYPFEQGQIRWVDRRDADAWLHPKRGGSVFEEVAE